MAKDLVSSCLYIHDARDALQRAKMLLKENFGQPYQITNIFFFKYFQSFFLVSYRF